MTARRLSIVIVITAALVINLADYSMANGFRNPPDGAAALGRAGGKITHIDDASAVSHNPANLLDIEQTQFMGSLTFASTEAEYESPLGETAKTRGSGALLPNIHAAWPIHDAPVAVGLGITTPFGQSTEWSKTSVFRYTAPYFAELTVLNFTPAIAARLNDRIAVGLSGKLFWSELDFRQIVPAGPGMPDGAARFDADGDGVGGSVGVTWQVTDRQRLALVYHTPVTVDYEGRFRVSEIPLPRSDFETEITFPAMVAMGYGLQINEKIRVGVDVEWIEFSRFDELPIDIGVNNGSGLVPPAIPQDWEDTWTIGVGMDWSAMAPWTVRAGYIFMETPIPSRTMAPTLPDADRHLVSVGLGYERGANAVDIAYAYSIFKDREIRDNLVPPYNGDYELSSHLFQISYKRSF